MKADTILNDLKAGNRRFVSGDTKQRTKKPMEFTNGQSPHTIVLSCADSRVPPELLFDQDLGDLFVIRIAGNTATDEAIASLEYAIANLGSSVCIVLGHTNCGAVGATVDYVKTKNNLPSQCLQKLVQPIIPSVHKSIESDSNNILDCAIDFNVQQSLEDIFAKSPIASEAKDTDKVTFIGAKYHLDSGEVEFF